MAGVPDRITIKITKENLDLITKFADEKEVSRNTVINLAINAGVKAIILAADPTWQKYFEAVDRNEKNKKISSNKASSRGSGYRAG